MAKKTKGISTKHMQIEKASSQIFIAVAIASVVIAFSIVLLNILWRTSQFNGRVQTAQEEVRDQLNANLEAVPDLETAFRTLELSDNLIKGQKDNKNNSEIILDALPSKFDFPEIATSMDNLAQASGVTIESLSGDDLDAEAEQKSSDPQPEDIPFEIEIRGTYSAAIKFLRGLNNSIRPYNVEQLGFSGTTDEISVSMTLVTQYQPAFDLDVTTRTIE